MEPFRWRRAFFLGIVIYAASIMAPVFDTFVPVLLQSGHPVAIVVWLAAWILLQRVRLSLDTPQRSRAGELTP